ncbi:MAG: uncharacterized protein JWM86_438 [Thermoleophilia bacterium]|nr:uncharacterized protein [Thermoleophilia bacterium]
MLVLLPPSETKATGGSGAPLELAALSSPELTPARERLLRALVRLGTRPKQAADILGLSPRQLGEIARNAELTQSPTAPAVERYTGVLFDALDIGSLSRAERARADARIAIASALFGLVRADDPIPAYRLSGGTTLPRIGTMRSVWRPTLGPVLADIAREQLVVDLRSGAYQSLAPVDDAVTVRVLHERADGARGVVSHFNKATKGRLARLLARTVSEPATIEDVTRVARRGGLQVERSGDLAIDIITRD